MFLVVGGYTQRMDENTPGRARGISVYAFDQHDGGLAFAGYVKDSNPSYVITDRQRSIIYSVCELPAGEGSAVCAHKVSIDKTGKPRIEPLGKVELPGSAPCHLARVGRALAVACYGSGQLIIVGLEDDGNVGDVRQTITFTTTTKRDSHIHCSVYQAARDRLLVTDLGDDKIKVLDRGADGQFTYRPELDVEVQDCQGPRHIALEPGGRFAIVNGECRGIAHLLDVSEEKIMKVHQTNVLPERVVDEAKGAAVRLSGNNRMVYISDRTFNVVNALRLDHRSATLRFRHSTPTGGAHPRDFILSPDDEWLLTANLQTSSIGVFKLNPKGELTHYRTVSKIPTPTSLAWL